MEDRKIRNETLHELMEDLFINEPMTKEDEELYEELILEDYEEDDL